MTDRGARTLSGQAGLRRLRGVASTRGLALLLPEGIDPDTILTQNDSDGASRPGRLPAYYSGQREGIQAPSEPGGRRLGCRMPGSESRPEVAARSDDRWLTGIAMRSQMETIPAWSAIGMGLAAPRQTCRPWAGFLKADPGGNAGSVQATDRWTLLSTRAES